MAILTIFLSLALVAGSALAADQDANVAVIENPGPNFRESNKESFECYVCDPAKLATCENRVDCCAEPKPEHLQACDFKPSTEDEGVIHGNCFKTSVLEGPFYRVTRGCGKKGVTTGGASNKCTVLPGDQQSTTCNCEASLCNGSSANKLGIAALATIIVSVVFGIFKA